MDFQYIDHLIYITLEYPIRVIIMLLAIGIMLYCIKEKYILSALLTLVPIILVIIVVFTDLLAATLKDTPIMFFYIIAIVYTAVLCAVYDYELSK
ncbi:hypothetical protein [Bacillus thuringiensis]|nr:hypothetical protein [Bacillus thuringiensis]